MSISTLIKSIQDIMRKDTGVDGDAQRIGQLVWMFFLKIFDDREKEYELMNENYQSPIPSRLRWLATAPIVRPSRRATASSGIFPRSASALRDQCRSGNLRPS